MKVVCVDDSPPAQSGMFLPNGHLVKGETYTVLRVRDDLHYPGYELVEKPIVASVFGRCVAWAWSANRFVSPEHFEAEFAVSQDLEVPTTNPHPLPGPYPHLAVSRGSFLFN